jgi:Mrp family chromosome partitioning ATPase
LGVLARSFFDDALIQAIPVAAPSDPFSWPAETVPIDLPPNLDGARALRTRLLQHPLRPRVVLVTSASPGDGKSAAAMSLAAAIAQLPGQRALLVRFGSGGSPGLLDVLAGDLPLAAALRQAEGIENLCILAGGQARPSGDDLLHHARWDSLCRQARAVFDLVVLDGPVWNGSAAGPLLMSSADGVLLAARIDATPRDALARALDQLAGPRFLGVTLVR